VALPHPSELACFEPRPGHSSRLAAMLGGPSRASSGLEEGLRDAADKELQRTGAAHQPSCCTTLLMSSLQHDTPVWSRVLMTSPQPS